MRRTLEPTEALRLLDGDLTAQSITDPDGTIQAIDWTITAATLTVDGETIDLLFDDPDCSFTDTVYVPPQAEGRCSSGAVLGSDRQVVARRARPRNQSKRYEGDRRPIDLNSHSVFLHVQAGSWSGWRGGIAIMSARLI